jgi:CxxC-x17-CxxC domain-containing protein
MGDFRRGGDRHFGGGGGGFRGRDGGRGGSGRDRDRGPVTMHQAVCDQCGKECEVPFRPSGDKPVYCNACFGAKKESGDNRGRDNRSSDRFPQKSFDTYKAPVIMDLGGEAKKGNNDEVKKQLIMLNEKMERLIKAVEGNSYPKPLAGENKTKQIIKSLPAVKAKKVVKKKAKK